MRDPTLPPDEAKKLENVRAKIAKSLGDPRPSIPADIVFDRIEELLESMRNNRRAVEPKRD